MCEKEAGNSNQVDNMSLIRLGRWLTLDQKRVGVFLKGHHKRNLMACQRFFLRTYSVFITFATTSFV